MKEIFLRFASENDCDSLFDWRNDSVTIQQAFNNNKIEYQDHLAWFDKTLKNQLINIFIILNENFENIGMIRFEKEKRNSEISINLSPDFRGKGYGTKALTEACNTYLNNFEVDLIIAKIKKENIASIKAFEKAGFIKYKEHDELFEYSYSHKK